MKKGTIAAFAVLAALYTALESALFVFFDISLYEYIWALIICALLASFLTVLLYRITRTKKYKMTIFPICILLCFLIASNGIWAYMYSREKQQLKNDVLSTLSNDYFTMRTTLVNEGYLDVYEYDTEYDAEYSETSPNRYLLDVPLILQNPEWPNGCEGAGAVMLLNYYNIDITLDEFFGKYLGSGPVYEVDGIRYGPNPEYCYAGDPSSTDGGWGVFMPAIINSLENILRDKLAETDMYYEVYTGSGSLDDITGAGNPLIIWTTINYEEVTEVYEWKSYDGSETYTYPKSQHVVVITGKDEAYYYINDPLKEDKNIKVEKNVLEKSYDSMGRQNIGIYLG